LVYRTILCDEFYENRTHIDSSQVDTLLGIALILGNAVFCFFGWLSDKIGRKSIMMTGMLLAILLYRPIYKAMYDYSGCKK
jgi:MFS family permease